jgi:hypothetical protein
MKIEHYSDHSVSFVFNSDNKELVVTLEYPQVRISNTELTIRFNNIFSIYREDYDYGLPSLFRNKGTDYIFEFVILGFGITVDLDVKDTEH